MDNKVFTIDTKSPISDKFSEDESIERKKLIN